MLFAAFRQIDLINSVGTVSCLFLPMPANKYSTGMFLIRFLQKSIAKTLCEMLRTGFR